MDYISSVINIPGCAYLGLVCMLCSTARQCVAHLLIRMCSTAFWVSSALRIFAAGSIRVSWAG